MGKTGGGCLIGMIFFGVGFPTFGLFLASVAGISWLGGSIGEHGWMVTTYVVVGMLAGYIIPGIATIGIVLIGLKSPKDMLAGLFGVVIYLVVVSALFAFPSSFIAPAACKAGNQQSVWVMRSIPIFGLTELALAKDNDHLACVNHELVTGNGN
jgi:hypothetical protein